MKIVCNFFAILENGDVRKINLIQKVIAPIRKIFVDGGNALFDDVEEIEFDGNWKIDPNEILFVSLKLPESVLEVATNAIGIPDLDLLNEEVKTLFWFEGNVYYFQNFDKRKLLKNKSILYYSNQTYDMIDNNGFIIDNFVNAVHKSDKLYFLSYVNANKIFSLADFYQEATDEEIKTFSVSPNVSFDQAWFLSNTNSVIRKQITLLQKSNALATANTKNIRKDARNFQLEITLDDEDKICFPNDKKACKEILLFLNEQYWTGLITGAKFKTNAKREIKAEKNKVKTKTKKLAEVRLAST